MALLKSTGGGISHGLATAVNDFLVASGAGVFVKKTLAEVKAILGLGSAAYTASTDYLANNQLDIFAYRKIGTGTYETWHGSTLSPSWLNTDSFSVASGTIYAVPFVVSRAITLDRIGIHKTDTVSVNMRLGIYQNDSSSGLYPGSLLLDAGVITASSTGVKSLTINQTLTPGLYWLVILADATSLIRGGDAMWMANLLGFNSTNFGSNDRNTLYATQTYGALPSTFPGSPTFTQQIPIIAVRLSA